MKVDMSCGGGQKNALLQDSHNDYEELTKVGGSPHHGGKQEGVASLREGSCPQCRRLLRVVYPTIALMVLCFGLILGMGFLQYMQYRDNLELSQRLEAFCPAPGGTAGAAQHPDTTGPPGSPGQVGKPPRGAGLPGGPWDLMPPTASDDGEEDEDLDEEEHRHKRSATGGSEGRAARGGRHTRHNRNKRCISCPTNMTTVEHLEGHPNSVQQPVTTDYGGADPRVKGDMFRNWRLADWSTGVKNKFNATTGLLAIEDPGLYWVYGQVMFYNSVFDNGFSVKIFRHSETAPSQEGQHLAMCMHTTDYTDPASQYNDKYRTCNVGIPALLGKGDRIGISSLYEGRMVVFSSTSSFWGIIKQSPPPP